MEKNDCGWIKYGPMVSIALMVLSIILTVIDTNKKKSSDAVIVQTYTTFALIVIFGVVTIILAAIAFYFCPGEKWWILSPVVPFVLFYIKFKIDMKKRFQYPREHRSLNLSKKYK